MSLPANMLVTLVWFSGSGTLGTVTWKWWQLLTTEKALRDYAALAILTLLTFGLDVATRRDWRRFFSRNVVTDIAYYVVYYGGFYIVLFSPVVRMLNESVTHYAPFLRLQLLTTMPLAMQVVAFIFISDFFEYWKHRWMHVSGPLWSMHKIHHSQSKMTIFTNFRFHVGEETFRRLLGFIPFVLLGSGPQIWIAADVVMALILLMQHTANNWSYGWLDAVFVSPRMHEVHHAAAAELHDRNFGLLFSFWDRLFGTHTEAPARIERFGIEAPIKEGFWAQMLVPLRDWRDALRRRSPASGRKSEPSPVPVAQ
jgi:sterol desaturase/sphingolipid hydroxylase (fatty acid hydroxylase superfamily)